MPTTGSRVFSISVSLVLAFYPFLAGAADIVISSSPANTGSYSNQNNAGGITVNANITQTNADGSGGTIDLGATSFIQVNQGRTLDVSATVAGKNGGTITLNAPALIINGILRANGSGSGRGGTINLNGLGTAGAGSNYIRLGAKSLLEAKGGGFKRIGWGGEYYRSRRHLC